jgi:hypothetical protein
MTRAVSGLLGPRHGRSVTSGVMVNLIMMMLPLRYKASIDLLEPAALLGEIEGSAVFSPS